MHRTEPTTVRWWQSLDPPIYLISVLPGAAVWLLHAGQDHALHHVAVATLAVILLQHAINVLNDVSDWRLGADVEKHHSWARFHDQDLRTAALHGYASLLGGGLLGLGVLIHAQQLSLLVVAIPLVALGYLYNSGPRPLAYTCLGEWVTGLCYGPGVFGCLWLLAGNGLSAAVVPGSLAFFSLAVALLLSHQPPQIETDRQAGKQSFAVRYGARRTILTARVLYLVFLLTFGWTTWQVGPAVSTVVVGITAATLSVMVILRRGESPRRILGGAAGVILIPLLTELAIQGQMTT